MVLLSLCLPVDFDLDIVLVLALTFFPTGPDCVITVLHSGSASFALPFVAASFLCSHTHTHTHSLSRSVFLKIFFDSIFFHIFFLSERGKKMRKIIALFGQFWHILCFIRYIDSNLKDKHRRRP